MVLCAKVERKNAEKLRLKLAAAGLLDGSFVAGRDEKFVYFAVKNFGRNFSEADRSSAKITGKLSGIATAEKKLLKREEHGKPLDEELKGNLTTAELDGLVKSFDIVGDIAVVEIPQALEAKQNFIANAILRNHHNIRIVAKKISGTSGEFRIRPVKVIAGERRTSTVYREGGCDFELDLNKTYFSPRLGTERARIASLVKPGENVLVPFAGVGPFAIRIGQEVPSAKVVGIELNPDAAKYFKRNIARNRCLNVAALKADVSKLLPGKYRRWADRIAMPLPKDGVRFLASIIPCLKKGGVLHYYSFGSTSKPYEEAEKKVKEAAKKLGRNATIIFRRVVRPYSKITEQVVVDARID